MTTKKPIGPPALYNEEAELSVLGSMIIDPAAYQTVRAIISAGDYYVQKHGWVHEAIGAAIVDGGAADFVALSDALERAGHLEQVGGMAFLTHLINAVPSSVYAEQYAQIVRDYAVRRAYVGAATQIAKAAYDLEREVPDVRNGAESAVLACRRDNDGGVHPVADVTDAVLNAIGEPSTAVPTGVGALDKALGGLEPAVYIVAARPSMGKTAFLLEMLANVCGAGQRCVLFSIEMSASQIVERLAARKAEVSLQAIAQKEAAPADTSKYAKALWEVATWPLTIVDKAMLTANDVLSDVQREQMQHGEVAAVFVDGLWLMTAADKHQNRVQEVGSISRDMKRVQRDLDMPIVMAHQLSRACELRSDKRPILSDLRETGDVEQDADVVLMMYREGYYDNTHPEANVVEVWIRKNRLHGPSGECVKLFWRAACMAFLPLAAPVKL